MTVTLAQAVATIKSGDKTKGKEMLIQFLQTEPGNDKAWVWMTAVVDTDELRLECLETALEHNPDNQVAQKGVRQLREKLGLLDPVVAEEEMAFPEISYFGSRQEQPVPQPAETWSYDKYKPEPPPPPKKSKVTEVGGVGRRAFLSTPFFTILFAPRLTVETMLEVAPNRYLLFLSVIIGIFSMLTGSIGIAPLSIIPVSWLILASLLLGPIYGLVYFYVAGFIFSMSGFVLGGVGTTGDVRAAFLWGYVPRLYVYPFQGIYAYLLARDLAALDGIGSDMFSALFLPLLCVAAFVGLWLFYVQVECIGAAHKVSFWRAWAILLFPTFLIFAVFCGVTFMASIAGAL